MDEIHGGGSGVAKSTTGHGDAQMSPRRPKKMMVILTLDAGADDLWTVLSTKTTVLEWQPSK